MRITLCGAAGEVTGSGYLVESAQARILVDFGMFQGAGATDRRNRALGRVAPARLDAVVLTHGHLDHTGRLPLLHLGGFRGRIHTTAASADVAALILHDTAHLQKSDAEREWRRLLRAGKPPVQPLFLPADVEALAPLYLPLDYNERREVAPGIEVRLVEAGHILGSASVDMTVRENGTTRRIVFSGDLGPKEMPFLRDPAPPDGADLFFLESTYGNRNHRSLAETVRELHDILRGALQQRMKVLIPAFAIGRTQQVLYHIAELVREGTLPQFPIYLDSPMAAKATKLYTRYQDLFDREATELVGHGLFTKDLAGLHFVETTAESKALNDRDEMAVVIAGSGMCDGGRIVHHLRHNLWRPNTAVVIVGYQARGSLGQRLVQGAKEVRILGEKIVVRATIHTLGGFSAHAGQSELVEWAGHLMGTKPRVVLTHGEPEARDVLRGVLKAKFGVEAECPLQNEVVELP